MKLLAKAGFSKQTSFKKKKAVVDRGEKIQGFLMAVIPFIGFPAFTAFPLGLTIFVSFTDLHSYDLTTLQWCGFDNYVKLFGLPMFKDAVVNTLYFLLSVPINLVSQLFIANLLNKPVNKTFKKIARLKYIVTPILIVFALPLFITAWLLYSCRVFDKFINKEHHPEYYNKGIGGI